MSIERIARLRYLSVLAHRASPGHIQSAPSSKSTAIHPSSSRYSRGLGGGVVEVSALGGPLAPGGAPGAVGTIPYGGGRPGRRCSAHDRDPHFPSHSAAGGGTSGAFRWRDSGTGRIARRVDADHVTTAAIAGVSPGRATRAGVIGRLGQPVRRFVRGPNLCCIAYAAERFHANRRGDMRAFCFRGGRLAAQRDW